MNLSNKISACLNIEEFDVVIVGGGPGGITAALTTKTLYKDKSVVLIKREEKNLIPCAIPYTIASIDKCDKSLISYKPLAIQGVKVVTDTVTDIDRENKVVITTSGNCYRYDKLILATGSTPAVPSIEGIDLGNVFIVSKNYEDVVAMQKTLREVNTVAIIGCGFVGVEIADELTKLDKKVVIVEILPHCLLLNLDEEFAVKVEEALRRKGVILLTNRSVKKIYGDKIVRGIELDNGEKIEVEAVVVAVGHKPNTELAEKIGLEIGRYGVVVDEYMRTSDPSIYAVGDVVEKKHFILKEAVPLMLSSIACLEARTAAMNLYRDKKIRLEGIVGVVTTKVGDLVVGCTGVTESMLKKRGIGYVVGRARSINRHPFFLPGACEVEVKLIFLSDGTLAGAQASGYCNEVAELVNALAIAIQNKMKVEDLIALHYGTQPMLTSSPITNPIVLAALEAYRILNQ